MESENTTFLNLPTTLQLNILKRCTSWTDQSALRLVCKHTLALLNHLDEFSRFLLASDNVPASIHRLTRYPFSSAKVVQFKNLVSPLPIISSARLQIPKTKHLILWENISSENMFKLTRYYMKCCESLEFLHTYFPLVKNISSFGPSHTCLVNVKSFKIFLSPRPNESLTFQDRLKSFGQFLLWCSMPSLQNLYLRILQHEPPQVIPFPSHNKFYENLQKFLIRHSTSVNQLTLVLSSSFYKTVISTFESMVNIEKLKIYESAGLEPISLDLVFAGFKHLTTLKYLCMDPTSESNFKLIEIILSNNQRTIQSMDLSTVLDGLSSLSWLYQIEASFPTLTSLTFKIRYDEECTVFSELTQELAQAQSKFKMDSLYKLTIRIESHFGGEEAGLDWRGSFLNWLILFSPNLQTLTLTYFYKTGPRISDILMLINGLTKLKCITFKSYRVYEMPWGSRYLGSQIQPNIISSDLENWFKSNPQIQLDVQTGFTCVNINRPYLIDQQPEEGEEI